MCCFLAENIPLLFSASVQSNLKSHSDGSNALVFCDSDRLTFDPGFVYQHFGIMF